MGGRQRNLPGGMRGPSLSSISQAGGWDMSGFFLGSCSANLTNLDHRRVSTTCPLHRSHQLRLDDREVRRPLATAEPPRLEVTVAASNITVETADARVSSDSTVRQSPRRRRTNDRRRVSTTCLLHRSHQLRLNDREVRRPFNGDGRKRHRCRCHHQCRCHQDDSQPTGN